MCQRKKSTENCWGHVKSTKKPVYKSQLSIKINNDNNDSFMGTKIRPHESILIKMNK